MKCFMNMKKIFIYKLNIPPYGHAVIYLSNIYPMFALAKHAKIKYSMHKSLYTYLVPALKINSKDWNCYIIG